MTTTTETPGSASRGAADAGSVALERVTKVFDGPPAVDDISLEIEHGSFFALLGPSGCGKTTTLRMIGGFEEPTAGRILLGGSDIASLPPYKRDVNTVFQSYALFPHLTIRENVAFGLRRKGVRGGELNRRVDEALELVDLAGFGPRKPRQISGGQQQRVALARALVNRPQVLLLDEPLGALDLKLRKQMQLELKSIQDEVGITFVHVTHDQEEAMTMADSIAVMHGGKIEQRGAPTDLYERPETAFVAGFLGISNLLPGRANGDRAVALDAGGTVRVPEGSLKGRSGRVSVGFRPEKVRIDRAGTAAPDGLNRLEGTVAGESYVGVSTQYIVETAAGPVSVYLQNADPGGRAHGRGDRVLLAWSPDSTFVVDTPSQEEEEIE